MSDTHEEIANVENGSNDVNKKMDSDEGLTEIIML